MLLAKTSSARPARSREAMAGSTRPLPPACSAPTDQLHASTPPRSATSRCSHQENKRSFASSEPAQQTPKSQPSSSSANSPLNRTSATSSPNSACATARQPSCSDTTTESSNPDDLDAPPRRQGKLRAAYRQETPTRDGHCSPVSLRWNDQRHEHRAIRGVA